MNPITRNFWITASLLVLTLGASKLTERRIVDKLAAPLESIPEQMNGWSVSKTETLDSRTLQILTPTSYLSRVYEKDHRQLGLFVAYYAVQRAGENMHSPKNCLPGSGWDIWRQDSTAVQVQDQPTQINKYSIARVGEHELMFYWYQSKKRIIASELFGKMMLVRDSLVDGNTSGLIARITVADTAQDEAEAKTFATSLIRELQRCFGR